MLGGLFPEQLRAGGQQQKRTVGRVLSSARPVPTPDRTSWNCLSHSSLHVQLLLLALSAGRLQEMQCEEEEGLVLPHQEPQGAAHVTAASGSCRTCIFRDHLSSHLNKD